MPEKSDADFREGEVCIYYEDDTRFKCEITERSLQGESLRLTLKILEVIQPCTRFPNFNRVGLEFSVDKNSTIKRFPGLWHLEEVSLMSMSGLN